MLIRSVLNQSNRSTYQFPTIAHLSLQYSEPFSRAEVMDNGGCDCIMNGTVPEILYNQVIPLSASFSNRIESQQTTVTFLINSLAAIRMSCGKWRNAFPRILLVAKPFVLSAQEQACKSTTAPLEKISFPFSSRISVNSLYFRKVTAWVNFRNIMTGRLILQATAQNMSRPTLSYHIAIHLYRLPHPCRTIPHPMAGSFSKSSLPGSFPPTKSLAEFWRPPRLCPKPCHHLAHRPAFAFHLNLVHRLSVQMLQNLAHLLALFSVGGFHGNRRFLFCRPQKRCPCHWKTMDVCL